MSETCRRLGQAPNVSVKSLRSWRTLNAKRQTSNAKRSGGRRAKRQPRPASTYSLRSVALDSGAQISGTDGIPASPHRFCSMMPLEIPSAIRWR